ncbi:MAG: hypothetical protein IIZ61_05235 [Lachnospiraceae bacterium]|nr:hypothetical protein [Lachnospiraceae bacterium]
MKKSKIKQTEKILIIVGIVIVLAIIGVLIFNAVKGNREAKVKEREQNAQMDDADVIPYGDDESDTYDFSGDYFDVATMNATMTIGKNGNGYNVSITYSETDDSITIWKMTASYNKNRKALVYSDCERSDYIMEEPKDKSDETEVDTNTKYTDGTGMIYLAKGSLYWVDDKEDMGTMLMFKKTTDIESEAGSEELTEDMSTETTESTEAEGTETEGTEGSEGEGTEAEGAEGAEGEVAPEGEGTEGEEAPEG